MSKRIKLTPEEAEYILARRRAVEDEASNQFFIAEGDLGDAVLAFDAASKAGDMEAEEDAWQRRLDAFWKMLDAHKLGGGYQYRD